MVDAFHLPVRDEGEVYALIDELPLAVDRERFACFVLGFPRRYLTNTPRFEIVKHFLLAENLSGKLVISSISPEGGLWKLCLIARDRRRLFSRIAGSLSCFGANIVSAEAFANAGSMVLDTFRFHDAERRFERDQERDRFQHFLEDVVEGTQRVGPLIRDRRSQILFEKPEPFGIEFESETHPSATHLRLRCGDHFGLLYLISNCISREDFAIEAAYIKTVDRQVIDDFYLTRQGRKLDASERERLRAKLEQLGRRVASEPERTLQSIG